MERSSTIPLSASRPANINPVKYLKLPTLIIALLAVGLSGCKRAPAASPHPLRTGHVEIQVDFQDLPIDAFNKISGFLTTLAEENSALREGSGSAKDIGDRHATHGWSNDGFAFQQYKPNHPVPSPEVEQAMRERLKTFLKDNKIPADKAQLKLLYGK